MADYIKREDALKILNKKLMTKDIAIGEIKNLPTADVVEVKHGEWKWNRGCGYDEPQYYCSLCTGDSDTGRDNYCPNCGARMDGGTDI